MLDRIYRSMAALALGVRPGFLVSWLGVIAAGLALLSLIGQFQTFGYKNVGEATFLYRAFDLDGEARTPTTFSALLLLGNAVLILGIAAGEARRDGRHALLWFILSGIFVYLAIDEHIRIHEEALDFLIPIVGIQFLHFWVIPATFIMLLLLMVYWRFLRDLPQRTRWLVLLSAAIYLGGALAIETVGGLYAERFGKGNLQYKVIADVEEFAEMAGMIAFAGTLLSYWRGLIFQEHAK